MLLAYQALKPFIFALFFFGAMGAFSYSCWRLARLARLGKDPGASLFKEPVDRIGQVIYLVFFQKRVVDEKFGWNHVLFFWAFFFITVGHGEFILRGIIPTFSLAFLGHRLFGAIVMASDVMAFLVLFAIAAALFRRLVLKPDYIHLSQEGLRVLGMIGNVMLTYFLATSFGIRGGHVDVADHSAALPISNFIAGFLHSVPVDDAAGIWYELFWWAHAAVLMAFLNYIPASKHLHLLGSIPNIYLHKREKHKAALDRLDFEKSEVFGAGKFTEVSWKGLLDTYACTECGRCDMYCPARRTGKPLEPQQLIHDLRGNMFENGDKLLAERSIFAFAPAGADYEPITSLIAASEADRKKGSQTSPEVLWACTSCGACVQACPVLIDHVDTIMDMRRHLTLMQGAISPELANTFKNVENNYNPWGIGADKRANWAEGMGLKYWGGSEDAAKFEYLFWVGCAGSYDVRAQKTMKAVTQILDAGGVSYAILGQKERCTGDPVRRTGNEYLFNDLAKHNVATLNELGVKKVVTACPHCFNTLKNEYPAFGGHYDVVHHTQVIDMLIDEGRIKLDGEMMKKVTFHDPCFLGRWNDETEAPRRSLAAVRHLNLIEMEEHGKKSMCCGAGGGQMWMEEKIGTRVNMERTRQALETEAEVIGVGCPFCMTMIEDGVKGHNREDVKVMDVAEIVAAALDPDAVPPKVRHPADHPKAHA